MVQITMTIPDTVIAGVLDAFEWNFPIPVDDLGDPLYTPAQWARLKLREFIRDVYRAYKANVDADTARQAAIVQADVDTGGVDVT